MSDAPRSQAAAVQPLHAVARMFVVSCTTLRAWRAAAALLVSSVFTLACGAPVDNLPTVHKPLDYWTVHVDLPGCAVRLPPVHAVPRCSSDEIGTRLDASEICRLLIGLKDWAGPSGWSLARSSCVRDVVASWPHRPGQVSRRVLTLYVDVPERSEVWFAQQTESEPVDYFVSPR